MLEPEVNCREFVDLVTDYLDDAMAPEMVDLVEEHLVLCDWCRDHLVQVETAIGATHELAGEAPEPAVLESLVGAFREARKGKR